MNGEQRSVTAAWIVVFAALGVQNHWLTQLTAWLASAPAPQPGTKSLVPGTNLSAWQAGIIAYAILLLTAESSDVGGLASVISWGVAITELLITIPKLKSEYPTLFQGGAASTLTSTQPQANGSSTSPSPSAAPPALSLYSQPSPLSTSA